MGADPTAAMAEAMDGAARLMAVGVEGIVASVGVVVAAEGIVAGALPLEVAGTEGPQQGSADWVGMEEGLAAGTACT